MLQASDAAPLQHPCAHCGLRSVGKHHHQPFTSFRPSSLPSFPLAQDNLYWLSLLTHLQADCVPLKSLDCLRDLRDMYEAATVDDVYDAYAQVGRLLQCCDCFVRVEF